MSTFSRGGQIPLLPMPAGAHGGGDVPVDGGCVHVMYAMHCNNKRSIITRVHACCTAPYSSSCSAPHRQLWRTATRVFSVTVRFHDAAPLISDICVRVACRLSTETIAVYHVLTRDCHSGVPRSPGGTRPRGYWAADHAKNRLLEWKCIKRQYCHTQRLSIIDTWHWRRRTSFHRQMSYTATISLSVRTNCNLHILTHISPVFYLSTFSYLESWTFIVLVYYGRPLSVSGCPCYILPMFFLNIYF